MTEKSFVQELSELKAAIRADERAKVIAEFDNFVNSKYPPNRFTDSYTGQMEAGVQEETQVRPLTTTDREIILTLAELRAKLEEMGGEK